jgi:hypothetical protein
MKTKQLIAWAVAFVVAVAVVVLAAVLRSQRPSEKSLAFFPGLSEDSVSELLIASKGDTVRVKRKGEVWVVAGRDEAEPPAATGLGGLTDTAAAGAATAEPSPSPLDGDFPVDSASLASVMEKLAEMKRGELVSQNPEKQALFEVDSAKGVYVRVVDTKGAVLGAFRVGKSGPGWSSHYVRMDGSNDVYSVRGSIKYAFHADRKRWRDKTIVKFAASSLEQVTLAKKGGVTIVLEKATDTTGAEVWNLAAPVKHRAAKEKVDEMVNALSKFLCTDWETSDTLTDEDMGFAEPELVATARLAGGTEKSVIVGSKIPDQSSYWVRTPERPELTFRVSSYNVEKLDRNVDVLKAAEEEKQEEGVGDKGA